MDRWTLGWVLWIAAFGALEGPALLNQTKGDTLSEHVWTWFAVTDTSHATRWRRLALLTFLAWLVVHLLGGGRFI
jgi:hypothetical protein